MDSPKSESQNSGSLFPVAAMKDEIAAQGAISPNSIEDCYPCTPLQEILMEFSSKDDSKYISRHILSLSLEIDLEKFQDAWNGVVASCEILRTRIVATSQGALQVVTNNIPSWEFCDSIDEYLQKSEDVEMSYASPLSRFAIIGKDYVMTERFFVWTAHQAIHDDHIVKMILDELCSIYGSSKVMANGQSSFTPFRSFVQRTIPHPETSLARNKSPPKIVDSIVGSKGWDHSQVTPSSTVEEEAIIPRSRDDRYDMRCILYSAWALVLSRYAQSQQVSFGIIEREDLIPAIDLVAGLTLQISPVKLSVDTTQSTTSFLLLAQQKMNSLTTADQITLDNLHSNQFSTLVSFKWPRKRKYECGTGSLNLLRFQHAAYPYPLVVEFYGHEKLHVVAHFDKKILNREQVQRMLHQCLHVARQLAAGFENQTVGDVEVLSPQDKDLIWKRNRQPFPEDKRCIPDVFGEIVSQFPDRLAICSWDGEFTYSSLDQQVTKLAHALRGIGVGPEVIVAVLMNKSKYVPLSMLAISKAGGAFIALDPQLPTKRLHTIATDGKIHIIVTDKPHVSICESLASQVFCVDDSVLDALPRTTADAKVHVQFGYQNRACVLYTSGSTGTPKGIDISHSAICTSYLAGGRRWKVSSDTRIYHFASYSFDASIADIFHAIFHGACLCIPSEFDRVNNLEYSIRDLNANFALLTPSVAKLLDPDRVSLKTMLVGGEPLLEQNISQWAPRSRLFGAYGPSECCAITSAVRIKDVDHYPLNIGSPVACRHWIIEPDNDNRLAPLGCVGELVIEGPTVSRGYLNRPELTAATFLRHPDWFDRQAHHLPTRFYKTGDLVKYDEDGSLIFVGRKDSQVKYHGQRIEPSDIEANINRHILVKDSVVIIPSSGPLSNRLVAVLSIEQSIFGVLEGESNVVIDPEIMYRHVRAVRSCTEKELPPFMWPTNWLLMPRLPLNISGKLNRKQLLEWVEGLEDSVIRMETTEALEETEISEMTEAVFSTSQKVIQECCGKTLQIDVEQISMTQPFIGLGGDSISAMQLVSLCRERGVQIDVRDILKGLTLKDLPHSEIISLQNANKPAKRRGPQEPTSPLSLGPQFPEVYQFTVESICSNTGFSVKEIQDIYPCAPVQEGILLSQSKSPDLYQTTHIFELSSSHIGHSITANDIKSAWAEVIRRHSALRTVFFEIPNPSGPFVQVILHNPLPEFIEHTNKSKMDECEFEGFLSSKPPQRLRIAPTPEGFLCRLEISHAITDGISMNIMFTDFINAFSPINGLRRSLPPTLHGDYVKFIQNLSREESLTYWIKHLKDTNTCHLKLPLSPYELSSPKLETHSFDVLIDEQVRENLRQQNLTIANVLQITWALLLRLYTGQQEVCFGYVNSARTAPVKGIEDAVGAFVNILMCTLSFEDGMSAFDLMEKEKNDFLSSMPHQYISMGDVTHGLGLSGVSLFNTTVSILKHMDSTVHSESHVLCKRVDFYGPTEAS
jgi:amino acid adenylation domain-containing protein